ncbi:hypothetical protein F4802DRAFT_595797 [Xylaria palmicola]|nr:hypothetical protein F4802DRAFT_595797 [Xylaria palmicola]
MAHQQLDSGQGGRSPRLLLGVIAGPILALAPKTYIHPDGKKNAGCASPAPPYRVFGSTLIAGMVADLGCAVVS